MRARAMASCSGAFDPLVLALVAVFVMVLALLASLLPAQRAARIDPMQALRYS